MLSFVRHPHVLINMQYQLTELSLFALLYDNVIVYSIITYINLMTFKNKKIQYCFYFLFLKDVLENDDIKLEWAFKVAILKDIAMVRIMLTLSREIARVQMIRFPNVSTLKCLSISVSFCNHCTV